MSTEQGPHDVASDGWMTAGCVPRTADNGEPRCGRCPACRAYEAERRAFASRVAEERDKITRQGYVETPAGRLAIPVKLHARTDERARGRR